MVEYVGRLTDLVIRLEVGGQESKRFLSDFSYLLNDKSTKAGCLEMENIHKTFLKKTVQIIDFAVIFGLNSTKF